MSSSTSSLPKPIESSQNPPIQFLPLYTSSTPSLFFKKKN
jgi:hypothetical protein